MLFGSIGKIDMVGNDRPAILAAGPVPSRALKISDYLSAERHTNGAVGAQVARPCRGSLEGQVGERSEGRRKRVGIT